MSKLKPCPFCGSDAKLEDCRTIWRVLCTNENCDAIILGERSPEPDDETVNTIDWDYFESTAINRWNNRIASITPEPMEIDIPVDWSNPSSDIIGDINRAFIEFQQNTQAEQIDIDGAQFIGVGGISISFLGSKVFEIKAAERRYMTVPDVEITKPKQPNFSRFQNQNFKHRGR